MWGWVDKLKPLKQSYRNYERKMNKLWQKLGRSKVNIRIIKGLNQIQNI